MISTDVAEMTRKKKQFKAEVDRHGCLACAMIRAYGRAKCTHNGVGPHCPRFPYTSSS